MIIQDFRDRRDHAVSSIGAVASWLVVASVLAGCASTAGDGVISVTPNARQEEDAPSATARSTASPTVTPSVTPTPSPTWTTTPAPTATPSILSPSNAANMRRLAVHPIPVPPRLFDVLWSREGEHIVAWTSGGWQLLDATSLEVIDHGDDMRPLWRGEGGRILGVRESSVVEVTSGRDSIMRVAELPGVDGQGDFPMAVSPNGHWIAVAQNPDQVLLVSLDSNERANVAFDRNFPVKRIRGLTFSPDGSLLAVEAASADHPVIVVDVREASVLYEVPRASRPSFSPDGEKLLVLGHRSLSVMNARSGVLYQTLSAGFAAQSQSSSRVYYSARHFSFVGDSLTVAAVYSAERVSQLIVWDLTTGSPQQTFTGLPGQFERFLVSPGSERFLSLGPDAVIRTWDLTTGEPLARSDAYQLERSKPAISPDGRLVAIAGIPSIRILSLIDGEELAEVGDYADAREVRVAFVGESRLAVEVTDLGWERKLELWDVAQEIKEGSYRDRAYCSFSMDASRMVCRAKYLQAFAVESGRLLGSLGTARLGYRVAISPDGQYIGLCSFAFTGDGGIVPADNISLYDATSMELVRVLTAPEKGICTPMAFSRDSRLVVSASGFVWSVPAGELIQELDTDAAYGPVSVAPGGGLALVGHELFNLTNGSRVGQVRPSGGLQEAHFSASGRLLVLVSGESVEYWGTTRE